MKDHTYEIKKKHRDCEELQSKIEYKCKLKSRTHNVENLNGKEK